MAAFVGGYIPVPVYSTGQGDLGTAMLIVGAFLLISIAVTAALVYFNPRKAQPAVKLMPVEEIRKAA